MSKNRLAEFNKYKTGDDDDETPEVEADNDEVSQYVKTHHEEVKKIEQSLKDIKKNLHSLEKAHAKSVGAITGDDQQKSEKDILNINTKIQKDMKDLKNLLDTMSKDIKEHKDEQGETAIVRIAESHHVNLSREFSAVIVSYQVLQEKHQGEKKKRMKRSIALVRNDLTEDEIEEIANDPNMNPQEIFKENKLTSTQKETLNVELAVAIETHNAIKEMARSMAEVHQLFVDFSTILAEQDGMIDNIADNVMKAREYVQKGTKNIKQADKMRPLKLVKKCVIC
jgi:t-SNARE complex subunit (syntaxin)